MVFFKRKSFLEPQRNSAIAMMRQGSYLKAQWALNDPKAGGLVTVNLMDGTRMTLAISFTTTGLVKFFVKINN